MGQKSVCCIGRPRAFDSEKALEKALEVFWRKGYDGTSLADLTDAMGINKPSLYAAFGNKEQLFIKAVDLYENRPNSVFHDALMQKTAYAVAEYMLYGVADDLADKSHPNGCVIVQGALSCSEAAASVKEALINKRVGHEAKIAERFAEAKAAGDLPTSADPEALARYLGTVLQGMTIQVTNGSDQQQLREIAKMALMAFPQPQ
ncbi:TetR family transcriptional regulator [Paraglaciecola hydrolytica]|uniref:TetR family transcriptional regulator n=1 Tax=Paraglaciecola hydrolytica TaxID=1799789 RepID=A0A135ZZT0_9ALTE|nr:TetR family transcriptional regulator [Paraglaciecola hydrolytica]